MGPLDYETVALTTLPPSLPPTFKFFMLTVLLFLDQMIARSEDEFEKFQQMDIERRRQEAALGADRKPRLIEESELPPFLLQVSHHRTFKFNIIIHS